MGNEWVYRHCNEEEKETVYCTESRQLYRSPKIESSNKGDTATSTFKHELKHLAS